MSEEGRRVLAEWDRYWYNLTYGQILREWENYWPYWCWLGYALTANRDPYERFR